MRASAHTARGRNRLQPVLVPIAKFAFAPVSAVRPSDFDGQLQVVRLAAAIRPRREICLLDASRAGVEHRPRAQVPGMVRGRRRNCGADESPVVAQDVVEERAALVPIPLASARKRQRGYNQSALIARGIGRRWRIPVWEDVIARSRETTSQTRLTPEERLDNVAGSFRTGEKQVEGMRGAHIVLVDDVVTTAATLNTCAKVLYESGARIISYVTFGRAHASGDRL